MKLHVLLFASGSIFCSLCYSSPFISYGKYIKPITFELNSSVKIQDQPESKKVKQTKVKNDNAREKEEKAFEQEKAKELKHRMDVQTPLTRERMKESKRIAEKNNNHYHKSIWQKIFGRRK